MVDINLLKQYESLSKCFERIFKFKPEFSDAHTIYLELKEVQEKLNEAENNFPELYKYPS